MWEDAEALEALAALEASLWEQGWERMRRAAGANWYELRFRPATSDTRPPAAFAIRPVGSRSRNQSKGAISGPTGSGRGIALRTIPLARRFGVAIRSVCRWGLAELQRLLPRQKRGAADVRRPDKTVAAEPP
jgi:hypothetical protein